MLNFAEQTGSGAVIVVWSFLEISRMYTIYKHVILSHHHLFITYYTLISIPFNLFSKCHIAALFIIFLLNYPLIIIIMLPVIKLYQNQFIYSKIKSKIKSKICFSVQINSFNYNSKVVILYHN